MKHVFPKWFYHKECLDGKIVYSSEELAKLGEGWVESPAHLERKEEIKSQEELKNDEAQSEEAQPAPEVEEKAQEPEAASAESKEEIQVLKKARKGAR